MEAGKILRHYLVDTLPFFIAYADKTQQIGVGCGNHKGQDGCENERDTQKTFYFKGVGLKHGGKDIIGEDSAVYPIKIRQSQPDAMQEENADSPYLFPTGEQQ